MVDFSISLFNSKVENPRPQKVAQRLSSLGIGQLESFCNKLTWSFSLNYALICIHAEKRYHQNTCKNIKGFFQNEDFDFLCVWILSFPSILSFDKLLIANFGYVRDDGFEEIECKNRCYDFPFGLPNSVLTKSHAVSQESFHVCNVKFLFGEEENFFD